MDSNELSQKVINEFDIFAVQIFLKCISLDEIIVGYFFGKKNENLEFIFYNFPASVQKLLPNINHNPHLHFKEDLTKTVNKLIPDPCTGKLFYYTVLHSKLIKIIIQNRMNHRS
ncbi:MAG: DUF4899 domain-containing protein [Candidatus Moranbacteria bacterium]|nr:DUF4899 domain-containing protein [Candidatus Moranbacteria bacterium]